MLVAQPSGAEGMSGITSDSVGVGKGPVVLISWDSARVWPIEDDGSKEEGDDK